MTTARQGYPPVDVPDPSWLRQLDHTADVGIEVIAPDLPTLFSRAAWGMFSLLTDLSSVESRHTVTAEVQARDREALLVRWLSELNYLHVSDGWILNGFDVSLPSERSLRATAHGEKYDPARHTIYTEIKAVTFHGLHVSRRAGIWKADVIFDV